MDYSNVYEVGRLRTAHNFMSILLMRRLRTTGVKLQFHIDNEIIKTAFPIF